jgi:hypothetical protein
MTDNTEDTVFEVDDSATSAQAVMDYLAEEAAARQEEQKQTQEKAGIFREVDTTENPDFHVNFQADAVFQKDEVEKETETYFVALEDNQIPVTDADQALYLKAMLNDTEVHLTQVLMGGQLRVECRALSVYEADMALLAAMRMSGSEGKEIPTALLPGCMQQIRVAMQVVKINDKAVPSVQLVPARKNQDSEIDQLIAKVDDILGRMNSGKYGMLVRALNVFEHKLARLNALAYTGNFWKPVETD